MLHIYMLRSFILVKCKWHCMGTVILTVKNNICTTPLLEPTERFILQKKFLWKIVFLHLSTLWVSAQ